MRYHYYFTFNNSHIKTDNPLKSVWDYFLKLSDIPYLKIKWIDKNIEIIRKVSTHIKQAYEYHISSKEVSLLTKPVLIYYSIHNLTKAFIELRGVKGDFNYHGLCNCTMGEDILDTLVYANKGVFQSLANCYMCEFDIKEELSFTDFLYNTIEGNQLLVEYFGMKSKCLKVQWHGTYEGFIRLELLNWKENAKDFSELNKIINENTNLFDDFSFEEDKDKFYLKSLKNYKGTDLNIFARELAEKYFTYTINNQEPIWIKLMPKEKNFNPALGYYGISFILSSIVRYEPEYVEKYIKNPNSSYEYLITKLLEFSERILPNLFINLMKGQNVLYE